MTQPTPETPGAITLMSAYWARLSPNTRGALWLLVSALFFVLSHSLVRHLGSRIDSFQLSFFRALMGVVVIFPFMVREGLWQNLQTRRPLLHLARATAGTAGMLAGFYAFTHLPLADATSFSFARALFLVPLAMIFLHEVAGPRRWLAAIAGFLGVLVMLRPTGDFDPAALVAVMHALFVAQALILVKILSRTDGPLTLLFYSGLLGTIITLGPALWVWQMPTWEELALIVLMGVLAVAGHNCLVRAYSVGEATAIAPVDYTRLIFAAMFGFLFFGDVPDRWTIVGALIISASSLYITLREAQVSRAKKSEPAAVEERNP